MKRSRSSEQTLPATGSKQTRSVTKPEEIEDDRLSIEEALNCLNKIKGSASKKNRALQGPLKTVEKIAQERGLAPEEIHNLLNIALSGKLGTVISNRLLKNLIPISVITGDSVISAVSWLCARKCSSDIQVLVLKWLIVMFDFIDQKENINALYGFFFSFLRYDKLLPFACHVLCLLTRMESVKPFHVRKLLNLHGSMNCVKEKLRESQAGVDQTKKDLFPEKEFGERKLRQEMAHLQTSASLQTLLWKYKIFAPEMVTITLPTKTKMSFRTFSHPWKTAIDNVKLRIHGTPSASQLTLKCMEYPQSQKKERNTKLIPPVCSSNAESLAESEKHKFFSLEQLQTFPQLLQNIQYLEPPAQIGSVIGNPLLLHYFSLKDKSVSRRMHYWMGHTLKEGCSWYKMTNQEDELNFKVFLEEVFKAECFLQRGFLACEEFLWKSLHFWDGCCCQSQVLQLVRWISPNSFSEMKTYLYQPLLKLFSISSLYFKYEVLESLRELLLNMLNCHMQADMATESNADVLNTTQVDLISSLAELIHFVNRLSTVGLCLENNSALLMNVILDFYETVSDIYLKYKLPLVIMLPTGVFYPALLSMNSATLDQLCYIMYRYRINLVAAKQKPEIKKFKFSHQICQEYNRYLSTIVGYLWTSQAFQESPCPQGIQLDPEVLEMTRVKNHRKGFNVVFHPALMGYAMLFLKKMQPEDTTLNFKFIRGARWGWYQEFLYSQGLQGLKLFIESSICHAPQEKVRH
uniref:centromere protein I isoform X1 n=1 Tax=Podarcis muralis TaxID=64176 RepID=UPI0010A048D3|nr:centromere protein I isoform X1 [Podarcis muralis]XP_028570780.1 centromere protein I isoform X1 [Podarcis muralis]